MASVPQINTPTGLATTFSLSTNQSTYALSGVVGEDTIALQVSINGSAWSTSNTLIQFSGRSFAVPNPDSYPDGLPLQLGPNTIQVRALDLLGGVSASATAAIEKVSEATLVDNLIPTGIRVARLRDSVKLLIAKVSTASTPELEFRGFHVYGASDPGGTSGRYKLTTSPLTIVSEFEEESFLLQENTVDFQPLGDYVRTLVTQEDVTGQTLEVVSNVVTRVFEYNNNLRQTGSLSQVDKVEFVPFIHNRSTGPNSDQFSDADGGVVYYTVTAIYYDPDQKLELETPHSQEVLGSPLVLDTNIRDLPGRTAAQVTVDFIRNIQKVNAEISLIPGSTTRDVTIDPFASEAERIWFIIDFVHRSQSWLTLMQLDDANGDGVSDPVASSAYKQALKAALGLTSDNAVQSLIDSQFDKLAGNVQKSRQSGRPATGSVVFYTTTRPTQDLVVSAGAIVSADADASQGIPISRFVVGGTYRVPATDADAYFNFQTQQYELVVGVVAESNGSAGNRPAGQIKNVVSGASRLKVLNRESMRYGSDRESNHDLAIRCQLGFTAVDSGTEGGYQQTSAGTVGSIRCKIVKSGDSLMMRDWDPVRQKHIGGKVDVWCQGVQERTTTETFSFAFALVQDVRCLLIDESTLTFQILDDRLTAETPLTELLNDASRGYGVRNATTGSDFNLSGYTIINYRTFRLRTDIPQPSVVSSDTVTADYRYRNRNKFVFGLQPVRRVVSVVGQNSGQLTSKGYSLYKTDDPLVVGESTLATDYLEMYTVNGVPSGAVIQVTNEPHVMVGFFEEPLARVGANLSTLRVYSQDRLVEYAGPGSSDPDFEVVAGTATTPIKVKRTSGSSIGSGDSVVFDYAHDENFTVTYVVNDLLHLLQRRLDVRRHTTADVLVKQAINNKFDFESTIQLKAGSSKDTVDPKVRQNLGIEVSSRNIGDGIAQSDVITKVDSTEGVDFEVLPLSRMGYADGSLRVRDSVSSAALEIPSLNIGGQTVYILTSPLKYPTTAGGGLETEHKGVFQDDVAMLLASDVQFVGNKANQAYIIGSDGAIIEGYSDDATLIAAGFTDSADILAERLDRTANHVLVALSTTQGIVNTPNEHSYSVSYVVRGDYGPHDLDVSAVEYLTLGNVALTFREKA